MNSVTPILKWAGGKRQLLYEIHQLIPNDIKLYCEPFLGSGAVLFSILPQCAYINDINSELVNVYNTVKNNPVELIQELSQYSNTPEFYYELRSLDRNEEFYNLSSLKRAARFIFLNKTCYNGLYRENKKGQFNTPYGKYSNPNFINQSGILSMSRYLNSADITITCQSFQQVLINLPEGCFVYLDPPYDTEGSSFTNYTKAGFDKIDHITLKDCCDNLNNRNIKFLLSNSNTEFIKSLYSDYNISEVLAKRNINCKYDGRGFVKELLIRNYK